MDGKERMGGVMASDQNPPRSRGGGGAADGGGAVPGITLNKRKQSLRKRSVDEARALRRTMSLPEVLLWRELKGAKLGASFRKQHPIGPYKADFCCTACKFVVEVDGMAHDNLAQVEHDAKRNAYIRLQGFSILRVAASDVLRDLGAVVEGIVAALPPLHHPAGGSPPRERGGF